MLGVFSITRLARRSRRPRRWRRLNDSFERISQLHESGREITGVGTGFRKLDKITAGLQPSNLVILAARPSVGKCLSAQSEIVLHDGSVVTIEEVYRRKQARLLTLGDDWRLGWAEPSAVWSAPSSAWASPSTKPSATKDA